MKIPQRKTLKRAQQDKREGKAPSSQAGEFVREEIHHIREGKHGAKNTRQAVAIGLSRARRAGVKVPRRGKHAGGGPGRIRSRKTSPRRASAVEGALKRMPRSSASPRALSRFARQAARRRPKASRVRAARKAARTRKRA